MASPEQIEHLILNLPLDRAILLRDALMFFRQSSKPESRSDIEELLKAVDIYLAVHLRRK